MAIPALGLLRSLYPSHHIVLITALSSLATVRARAATYSRGIPEWVSWLSGNVVDQVLFVNKWTSALEWAQITGSLKGLRLQDAFLLPFYGEPFIRRMRKVAWLQSISANLRIHFQVTDRSAPPPSIPWQMWEPWSVVASSARHLSFGTPLDHYKFPGRLPAECHVRSEIRNRYICIYPSATHAFKRWPAERFVEVCRRLSSDQINIVFVGSEQEGEIATRVANLAGLARAAYQNLCGVGSLHETAAILKGAALFVGNDGGLSHLASLVGTPVVTIVSGIHRAGVWRPAGNNVCEVRFDSLDCIGCGNEIFCKRQTSDCIERISVNSVMAAINTIIKSSE